MIKNKFKNKRFVVLSSLIVISSIGVGAILASCKDNTKPEPKNSVPNQQLLTNTGANKTNNANNGTNDNNPPKPSEKQKEDVNKQTNKEADKLKEEQPVSPKTDSQNPPKVSETEQEENKTQNQPKDENKNKNENSEFKEPELTENPPVIQEPNKEETQPEKQVESVPAPRKEEKEKEKPLEVVPEEKILTRDQLIEGGRKVLDWLYKNETEKKISEEQKNHAFSQKDGAKNDVDIYEVDFGKLFNLTTEEADKLMADFFTEDYKNSKNILKVKKLTKKIWRSYWTPLTREWLTPDKIKDKMKSLTVPNIVDGKED